MHSNSTSKAETGSIQGLAKVAGILYLLIALLAGFVHMYVPGALLVPGDAAAYAASAPARLSRAAKGG